MAFVARRPFHTSDALIVVSTDGYFDVFAPTQRRANARPAYRGRIAELGPDSAILDDAVVAWSSLHGAEAVNGDLGFSHDTEADAGGDPGTTAG